MYQLTALTGSLDFTMCNPPFYASRDEMLSSAEAKEKPPSSVGRLPVHRSN